MSAQEVLLLLLCAVLIVTFVLFLRRGPRSISDRTPRDELNPARQTFSTKLPPRSQGSAEFAEDNPLAPLLGLATMALISVVAFKGLQKGYSFLKGLNWESLDPVFKEAINRFSGDVERIRDNAERLNKADSLLSAGDKISIDQAAMLASATLEAGLKILCKRNGPTLDTEAAEGMAGIAIALKNRGVISAQEYGQIKNFVSIVRNKAMHGDFDSLNKVDVGEQIDFTREFFKSHRLI